MELGTGYPGYDTVMGKDTATVAEVLKQKGWNTSWFGKNRSVPDWQTSQAGPFALWPTGLGFEHFYGFLGGDTNQWRPAVFEGTRLIEPYLGKPVFHYNFGNVAHFSIAAADALTPGKHTVVFDFKYDGGGIGKGGTGTLGVDGQQVAQGRIGNTMPIRIALDEMFDVGEDTGTPVSESYGVPFKFTGQIQKVVVNLGETRLSRADEEKLQVAERQAAIAAQ